MLEYIPETVYKVARQYAKSKQTIPINFIRVSWFCFSLNQFRLQNCGCPFWNLCTQKIVKPLRPKCQIRKQFISMCFFSLRPWWPSQRHWWANISTKVIYLEGKITVCWFPLEGWVSGNTHSEHHPPVNWRHRWNEPKQNDNSCIAIMPKDTLESQLADISWWFTVKLPLMHPKARAAQ